MNVKELREAIKDLDDDLTVEILTCCCGGDLFIINKSMDSKGHCYKLVLSTPTWSGDTEGGVRIDED